MSTLMTPGGDLYMPRSPRRQFGASGHRNRIAGLLNAPTITGPATAEPQAQLGFSPTPFIPTFEESTAIIKHNDRLHRQSVEHSRSPVATADFRIGRDDQVATPRDASFQVGRDDATATPELLGSPRTDVSESDPASATVPQAGPAGYIKDPKAGPAKEAYLREEERQAKAEYNLYRRTPTSNGDPAKAQKALERMQAAQGKISAHLGEQAGIGNNTTIPNSPRQPTTRPAAPTLTDADRAAGFAGITPQVNVGGEIHGGEKYKGTRYEGGLPEANAREMWRVIKEQNPSAAPKVLEQQFAAMLGKYGHGPEVAASLLDHWGNSGTLNTSEFAQPGAQSTPVLRKDIKNLSPEDRASLAQQYPNGVPATLNYDNVPLANRAPDLGPQPNGRNALPQTGKIDNRDFPAPTPTPAGGERITATMPGDWNTPIMPGGQGGQSGAYKLPNSPRTVMLDANGQQVGGDLPAGTGAGYARAAADVRGAEQRYAEARQRMPSAPRPIVTNEEWMADPANQAAVSANRQKFGAPRVDFGNTDPADWTAGRINPEAPQNAAALPATQPAIDPMEAAINAQTRGMTTRPATQPVARKIPPGAQDNGDGTITLNNIRYVRDDTRGGWRKAG